MLLLSFLSTSSLFSCVSNACLFKTCLSLAHPCSCFRLLPGCQLFPEISLWWPVPLPTCSHSKHLYASSQPCNQPLTNVCWKNHLSELSPMLSLSIWPIKKLGSTLTAFLSSCSLRLWQMRVIFLVLHLAFSLWIRTLFVQHPAHKIKIKAPVHYGSNNKYYGCLHSLCSSFHGSGQKDFHDVLLEYHSAPEWSSFQGFFFRSPQMKFSFTGVLPIMPSSLTEPASLLGFFSLPITEL